MNEKKICKEYQSGAKQVELALKYKMSKEQIKGILLRNNIPIRRKVYLKEVAIFAIILVIALLILNWVATL